MGLDMICWPPIPAQSLMMWTPLHRSAAAMLRVGHPNRRSEEHTSELQSLMRISYAVFCLKKKKIYKQHTQHNSKLNSSETVKTTTHDHQNEYESLVIQS